MTDYLITNSAAVLGGIEDASVPGSFDPAFASHALRFDEEQAASVTLPGLPDIWARADCFYDDFDLTTNGDGWFLTIGLPGIDIARIGFTNGARTLDYTTISYSAPNQTGTPVTGMPDATRFTLDVHVETGAAVAGNVDDYRVTLFVNLSLVAQVVSKADKVNGQGAVRLDFGGTDFLDGNQRRSRHLDGFRSIRLRDPRTFAGHAKAFSDCVLVQFSGYVVIHRLPRTQL